MPRVVARVNNPSNEWMFNASWGVDVSVSTPHLLTALVEEAVSVGSLVRLLSFENDRARLSEVTLAENSPAEGVEIQQPGPAPRLHRRGRAPLRPPRRPPRRHGARCRRRGPRPGHRRRRGRGPPPARRLTARRATGEPDRRTGSGRPEGTVSATGSIGACPAQPEGILVGSEGSTPSQRCRHHGGPAPGSALPVPLALTSGGDLRSDPVQPRDVILSRSSRP